MRVFRTLKLDSVTWLEVKGERKKRKSRRNANLVLLAWSAPSKPTGMLALGRKDTGEEK